MRRQIIACVLAAMGTTACGGGDNPAGPSETSPPFSQTVSGNVSASGSTHHPLTIPRSGNMTIRLRWLDGNVDLDLYLSNGLCRQLSNCYVVAESNRSTGTNESIFQFVRSGEQFQIWVNNPLGSRSQSYTLTTTIN